MVHNIISTLLSVSLVVGLAAACGGPLDGDPDSNASAAASKTRKDNSCGPSHGGDADGAPSTGSGEEPPVNGGGFDFITCWCNTEQGSGDGSGCYLAVSGGSCSGECECSNICGDLQD